MEPPSHMLSYGRTEIKERAPPYTYPLNLKATLQIKFRKQGSVESFSRHVTHQSELDLRASKQEKPHHSHMTQIILHLHYPNPIPIPLSTKSLFSSLSVFIEASLPKSQNSLHICRVPSTLRNVLELSRCETNHYKDQDRDKLREETHSDSDA